jgi:hypothetical protein
MTKAGEIPVVLFLFNRPGTLARVVDALRRARPALVLLIADGPRDDHPEDVTSCAAARRVIAHFDWPCVVERNFAETNMGLSQRITSGLDWVFREFSEAIVLEDDIVPDPSFFPWCLQMLDRYRDDPAVMHVTGRNHLGRWTALGDGHCLLGRASVWGWATWRRAWQREVPTPGTPEDIVGVARNAEIDPLVIDHLLMLQELARVGSSPCWDTVWEIKKGLAGGLSVVPSVNLVAHEGFGPEAVYNRFVHSIGALTPVGAAPTGREAHRCVKDRYLDRWSLLFELMATYHAPLLAWRFSRVTRRQTPKPWAADTRLRHHMAPFRNPREALRVLEHFCSSGAPAEPLKGLFDALCRAAADMPPEMVSTACSDWAEDSGNHC